MNHKKQKKSILKRITTWLLSLLMIISSFLSSTNIKAASVGTISLGRQIPYSYNVTGKDGYNEFAAVTNEILADGEIAFCVQPGHVLRPGTGFDKTDYTIPEQRILSIISYEGWDTSSKTPEDFLATQLYIWEYMGGRINSTTLPNWASRKALIANRIAKHDTRPSFNGKSISLNVGDSITLTDTNDVFNQFSLKSNDGLKVSKSGNKLTITATANAKDNSKIVYNKIPDKYIGTSILYRNGSQNVSKLYLSDPLPTFINVRVNKYGSLNITKQDEDGNNVPNTTFKLSKNSDMSSPIGTYTTGGNGSVLINQLLPATYFVQETAVPSHLVLDNTIRSVTVKPNETASYIARNNWVKGKIAIRKTDSESGKQVAGATYGIFNNQNQELQRLVTTATGYAESGYLRFGNYYAQEVIAPDGYVLNDTKYPVTISSNEQKIDVTGNDIRVKGSVNISKEDSVTGDKPQGQNTSLAGAVYELRARNPILDPADKSVLFAKDAVVATLTTDDQAKASVNDLYLGDYYLVETKASPGYTLDPTEYEVSIKYSGQSTPVVTKNQTVKERVIAQAFSIIKISDNGNGESDLLKGVEFTIKAQKDIDKYGSWEKAPIAKNAKGKDASVLVTDEKGYALSDELPYGTYVVRETKVPDEHYKVDDFTVVVDKDSRDPQPWRVFNDQKFKAVAAIVKKDAETGKTVALAGASFKIRNTDTGKFVGSWVWNPLPTYVDEWTTNETGQVMTNDVLTAGNYELIETKAPEGYTLDSTPIPFKISNTGAFETLPDGTTPVITVLKENTSVKGRITVSKEGEVLTSTSKDDKGNTVFNYKKQKLANAVFEVYANEDIKSADNQEYILYKKGEIVQTLTTKASGTDTTKLLPLGKYQVKEKTAPDGFTHSAEVKDIVLTYKDQNTAVVFDSASYLNERQKVDVKIVKKDADTQTHLQGAIFGLSANADIYTPDHKLLVKKGTLIETAISDEKGNVSFKADLPLTKFTVKEITPPTGYASSNEVVNIDASYQGQTVKTITYEKEFLNKKLARINVQKIDTLDPNLKLENIEFNISTNESMENVLKTEKTNKEGIASFKDLELGTYFIQEAKQIDGYVLNDHIYKVDVTANGETLKINIENKPVEMEFSKLGETGVEELEGATLQVIDKEIGKVVDEWISTKDIHPIKYLVEGKEYTMKEVKAPNGYEIADPIDFVAKDGLKVTMKDKKVRSYIKVNKVDYYNHKDVLKVAEFTLYSDAECKQPIKTAKTNTKDGIALFDNLTYSTYYIKETKAPAGYQLSKEVIKVTIDDNWVKGNDKTRTIIFPDKPLPVAGGVVTGDTTNTIIWIVLIITSISFVVLMKRKNRKHEER